MVVSLAGSSDLNPIDSHARSLPYGNTRPTPGPPKSRLKRALQPLAWVTRKSKSAGIPGTLELLNGLTDLIGRFEASEETQSEYGILSARLQQIMLVVQQELPNSPPEIQNELIQELYRIQHMMDRHSASRMSSRVFHSNNKLLQYGILARNVDHLVEALQLGFHKETKLWHADIQAQIHRLSSLVVESSSHIQELHDQVAASTPNFDKIMIREQLRDTYVIRRSSLAWVVQNHISKPTYTTGSSRDVLVSCSTGYLSNTYVVKKTYSSVDPDIASKLAHCEIQWLRSYVHPNVAQLRRDLNTGGDLRNIVMSSGKMPCGLFLVKTVDPAVLANFLRGSSAILELQEMHGSDSKGRYYSDPAVLTVDPSGRLVVLPPKSLKDLYIDPSLVINEYHGYGSLHPPIRSILEIHESNISCRYSEGRSSGGSKIVDTMSRLGIAFTMLDVMKAARDAWAIPPYHFEEWVGQDPPSFTVAPLDIGIFTEGFGGVRGWKTLDSAKPTKTPSIVLKVSNGTSSMIRRTDDWISYEIEQNFCRLSWYDRADAQMNSSKWIGLTRRAAELSGNDIRELGSLSTNCCILFSIQQKYNPGISSGLLRQHIPKKKLYFHRNPSLTSDPFRFWGFVSSQPNPLAQCLEGPEQRMGLIYEIALFRYNMCDDYGYKHHQMISLGLGSIPGTYQETF